MRTAQVLSRVQQLARATLAASFHLSTSNAVDCRKGDQPCSQLRARKSLRVLSLNSAGSSRLFELKQVSSFVPRKCTCSRFTEEQCSGWQVPVRIGAKGNMLVCTA